jgi:hypothetical protein
MIVEVRTQRSFRFVSVSINDLRPILENAGEFWTVVFDKDRDVFVQWAEEGGFQYWKDGRMVGSFVHAKPSPAIEKLFDFAEKIRRMMEREREKATKLEEDVRAKLKEITPIAKRMFPHARYFETKFPGTYPMESEISFTTDIGNVVIKQPHSKSVREIEVELANRLERLNNPGGRSSRSFRSSYRGSGSRRRSYGGNAASDVGDSGSGLGDTMGGDDGGE